MVSAPQACQDNIGTLSLGPVVNGTKTWITNGVEGSCMALLVKTDPAAEPRHKGMSLFIAPKAAGFTMRIHGAYGCSKEYDIERLYRDAPLTVIGEGTNDIQRVIVAKQWLKRNPVA